MITRYITSLTTRFSPFNHRSGKTARNFLALLPPNARSTMSIDVQMLGRSAATEPATLALKFSEYTPDLGGRHGVLMLWGLNADVLML